MDLPFSFSRSLSSSAVTRLRREAASFNCPCKKTSCLSFCSSALLALKASSLSRCKSLAASSERASATVALSSASPLSLEKKSSLSSDNDSFSWRATLLHLVSFALYNINQSIAQLQL